MRTSEDLTPTLENALSIDVRKKQGSAAVEDRPTYTVRSVASKTAAAFRTIPTLLAYGVVHVLMRVAPDGENYRRKIKKRRLGASDSTALGNGRGYKLIGYFVSLYRRSLLRNYLHRSGDPCRFIPSCSEYAVRATEKYGLWRGLILTGDRFRRCTPSYRGDHWVDFP